MEAKCAFLVALIACLQIVSIEGIRPFWPENKPSKSIIIDTIEANYKRELGEQRSQLDNLKGEVKSAVVKNQEGHFGKSGTAAYNDEDDFRPTTPGNSPGAGHKSLQDNEPKAVVGGKNFFTAGMKDDYRPTTPGHSPGAGHAIHENVKPRP